MKTILKLLIVFVFSNIKLYKVSFCEYPGFIKFHNADANSNGLNCTPYNALKKDFTIWCSEAIVDLNKVVIWTGSLKYFHYLKGIKINWSRSPQHVKVEISFDKQKYISVVDWTKQSSDEITFTEDIFFSNVYKAIDVKIHMKTPKATYFGINYVHGITYKPFLATIVGGISGIKGANYCLQSENSSFEKHTDLYENNAVSLSNCLDAFSFGDGRELFHFSDTGKLISPSLGLCVASSENNDNQIILENCETTDRNTWNYTETGFFTPLKTNSFCITQKGLHVGLADEALYKIIRTNYSDPNNLEHSSFKIVDGDINTYWLSKTLENNFPVVLVEVDLGGIFKISSIEIDWVYPAYKFDVQFSQNNETFHSGLNNIINKNYFTKLDAKSISSRFLRFFLLEPLENLKPYSVYGIRKISVYVNRLKTILSHCSENYLQDGRSQYFFELIHEYNNKIHQEYQYKTQLLFNSKNEISDHNKFHKSLISSCVSQYRTIVAETDAFYSSSKSLENTISNFSNHEKFSQTEIKSYKNCEEMITKKEYPYSGLYSIKLCNVAPVEVFCDLQNKRTIYIHAWNLQDSSNIKHSCESLGIYNLKKTTYDMEEFKQLVTQYLNFSLGNLDIKKLRLESVMDQDINRAILKFDVNSAIEGYVCVKDFSSTEKSVNLSCDKSVRNSFFQSLPYDVAYFHCDENCTVTHDIKIYGTNIYRDDSSICLAAQHLGLKLDETIKLIIMPGMTTYTGSLKNLVQSQSYTGSKWDRSFMLEPVGICKEIIKHNFSKSRFNYSDMNMMSKSMNAILSRVKLPKRLFQENLLTLAIKIEKGLEDVQKLLDTYVINLNSRLFELIKVLDFSQKHSFANLTSYRNNLNRLKSISSKLLGFDSFKFDVVFDITPEQIIFKTNTATEQFRNYFMRFSTIKDLPANLINMGFTHGLCINDIKIYDGIFKFSYIVKSGQGKLGLFFRMRDKNNMYLFEISKRDSTKKIFKIMDGKVFLIRELHERCLSSVWYNVEIHFKRYIIEIYHFNTYKSLNSTFTILDESYKAGSIGYIFDDIIPTLKNIQYKSENCTQIPSLIYPPKPKLCSLYRFTDSDATDWSVISRKNNIMRTLNWSFKRIKPGRKELIAYFSNDNYYKKIFTSGILLSSNKGCAIGEIRVSFLPQCDGFIGIIVNFRDWENFNLIKFNTNTVELEVIVNNQKKTKTPILVSEGNQVYSLGVWNDVLIILKEAWIDFIINNSFQAKFPNEAKTYSSFKVGLTSFTCDGVAFNNFELSPFPI